MRFLPFDRLENQLAFGVFGAAIILGLGNLDLFRGLGNIDERLAFRARPLLPAEFLANRKAAMAAGADNGNRHGESQRDETSEKTRSGSR